LRYRDGDSGVDGLTKPLHLGVAVTRLEPDAMEILIPSTGSGAAGSKLSLNHVRSAGLMTVLLLLLLFLHSIYYHLFLSLTFSRIDNSLSRI
jgi:hypothetical protein